MLSTETRRQIVHAATLAAILTAASDFTSVRRADSLTSADRHILADLDAVMSRVADQGGAPR